MNVRIVKGAEVTRPTTTPLGSSVLDHATIQENASFGLRNNAGLWPSYNCLDTLVPTTLCPSPLQDTTKSFGSAVWVPGFEFAVYGAVQCRTVGLDRQDMASEIARVFALNEGKGVEQVLLYNRFVATDSDAEIAWGDPVDLSSANMTLLGALAALVGYSAAVYAGQPTIHMPRSAAVILSALGAIKDEGGILYTKTGAKIAAGGGYDDTAALSGTFDLYATGEVYVERSEKVEVTDVHVLPGDGSGIGSGENGLMDNTVIGLAERLYRVGVDCFVAKATGTVWTP